MKRIAIMQPTYLPWCGYFGMMHSVDLFIFLDSVQFDHRGWQQRNQIKTPKGPQWLTVPVFTKRKRKQLICDVVIDKTSKFPDNHIKSIKHNYKKAPFFNSISEEIFSAMLNSTSSLVELNIEIIEIMKRNLGIKTKTFRATELNAVGIKDNLLASICKLVGATEYISPPGSKVYLDLSYAFNKIGVTVKYFQFNHPDYPQLFNGFLEKMSVIDLLMNCGDESLQLIDHGSEIIL